MEAEIPAHVFQPNWSKLSKDDVIDKVKGTLYGQAIGDAIGLATEFMSKAEVKKYYTKKGPLSYNDIIPDFHRSRWLKGDWTDDTDQMLLILLGVLENNGKVLKEDFARRMKTWAKEGFAELGDRGGLGIGMTTHHTICHKRFLEDPHKAAYDIWESSGFFLAANGAAMRTSVLGIVNFNDLDKVWENTREISLTTHADPRCTASCIAITTAIALMLQGEYDPNKSKQLTELVNRCVQKALEYLSEDEHKKELTSHAMAKSWDKLVLDDRKTMGYTYKTLGAGYYALRNSTQFRKTIMELVMQGGDADTNGAVAGALMGCKFGYKNLPEDLLNFPHRKWLDRKVHQFLKAIGLAEEQQQQSEPHKEAKMKEDTDTGGDMETSESPRDDVTSDNLTRENDDVTETTNDEQEDLHDKEKMTDNLHTGDSTAVADDNSSGVPDTISPSINPPNDVITDDITTPSGDHTSSNAGPLTNHDDVTDQTADTTSSDHKQDI